ncbi:hypothetical protein Tco_1303985 [Tanacetum coccineum]
MAYVDHAFSISDEDIMMDSHASYTSHNRPPVKEISLAVALLVFGIAAIVSGVFMSVNRVGGDTSHGQPNKKKSKNVVFTIYLNKTGTTLALDIKELKSDTDVEDMLNASYDNGNMIDLFVEHYDYDVMGLIDLEPSLEQNLEDSDCYSSDDCEKIDDVDFQTECDDNVVIKDISTSDPFLNKLCSTRALFRGSRKQQVPDIDDIEEDPDNDQIDLVHKLALTNYGVAYSYQLWYMKNDWRSVLVYCGRNVAEGRCAGKKGNKNRVMPNKDRSGLAKKTNVGNGEGSSKQVKKIKVKKVKKVKKKHVRNDSGGVQVKDIGGIRRIGIGQTRFLVKSGADTLMWELSGVPCVHVVADYMHLNHDLDTRVSFWYSQEAWFNAYQFSMKPVTGSRKHNKASCKNETRPKPGIKKPPGRKRQHVIGETASRGGLGSRGGGRGGRGSGRGGENNGRGGGNTSRGSGNNGRGGGNSSRGGGNNGKGEQEYQLCLDEEAFRETMEEQDRLEEECLNSQATVDKGKAVEAIIKETHKAVDDTTKQAKVDKGKVVDDTTEQGKSDSKK